MLAHHHISEVGGRKWEPSADTRLFQITHTNDLTALALTNSAFYNLAIPLIYSRFDIVWPDGHIGGTESKSVDALTYGLSTLCLGNSFARSMRRANKSNPNARRPVKLADNHYANYTKKFSLGNGPGDWVAEYMIHKESGRMLGILVATAIQKMKNLETFVWDMPTGVLSQVFMALSSLADQSDNECKLNRVWIRWHDNSYSESLPPGTLNPSNVITATALVPPGSTLTPVGIMVPPVSHPPPPSVPFKFSEYPCEYPTFSCLPPLKSLTVLDIDELGYLDEMAVLIECSKDILQELRVGISANAVNRAFAQTWDGPGLKQIDHRASWPGESTIGDRRLGGVLGILVGKIYDIRKRRAKDKPVLDASVVKDSPSPATPVPANAQDDGSAVLPVNGGPSPFLDAQHYPGTQKKVQADAAPDLSKGIKSNKSSTGGRKRLEGKLKLHTLELERVALSLQVCRHAIDWSVLTNLTLFDCAQHDNLWKMLRKQFQPTPVGTGFGISSSRPPPADTPLQYHLALKGISTDTTTASLITFIKETLAPNSLEVLFLQDRKRTTPALLLDTIFKGALKRHCASLRKLLLDSSSKVPRLPAQGAVAPPPENPRWRHWTLTTEILMYLTSGRMTNLRELAVSIEYKDWVSFLNRQPFIRLLRLIITQHTFLQRLPNLPQLRSINIPHVAEYPIGGFEPRELAHQIVDIITLRQEIRLCYIGISSKCFEVLEYKDTGKKGGPGTSASGASTPNTTGPNGTGFATNGTNNYNPDESNSEQEDTSEDEEEGGGENEDPDDEEDDEDSEDDSTPTTAPSDPDETQSDNGAGGGDGSGDEDEEEEDDDDGFVEPGQGGVKLKLREILFYDDKVAIFRARHGKL
jgi:hypothetical protein